jgi:hypothetical protein
MPVLASEFSGVTPEVSSQVAAVMREFIDKGVVVRLRFAHEMNWYVDPVRPSNLQFNSCTLLINL